MREYEKHYKNFKEYIKNRSKSYNNTSQMALELMANEALIDSMKIFGNFELKNIKRNIQLIKEYYSPQNDLLLRYINFCLRELDENTYDRISYFISDIIYSLNSFGNTCHKVIEGVHTWYRGLAIPFSDLLLYKQNEGGEITFPSFTSCTNILTVAMGFYEKEKLKMNNNCVFSILLIIKYNCTKEDIPLSIDVQELTRDDQDKMENSEVRIILPYSFYKIKKVEIIEEIKFGKI